MRKSAVPLSRAELRSLTCWSIQRWSHQILNDDIPSRDGCVTPETPWVGPPAALSRLTCFTRMHRISSRFSPLSFLVLEVDILTIASRHQGGAEESLLKVGEWTQSWARLRALCNSHVYSSLTLWDQALKQWFGWSLSAASTLSLVLSSEASERAGVKWGRTWQDQPVSRRPEDLRLGLPLWNSALPALDVDIFKNGEKIIYFFRLLISEFLWDHELCI